MRILSKKASLLSIGNNIVLKMFNEEQQHRLRMLTDILLDVMNAEIKHELVC